MKDLTVLARTLLLVLGVLSATPLLAHNKLASTSPADAATLAQSPATIDITFADATYLESVELLSAGGEAIALDFVPPADLASSFSIPVPALSAGAYTVRWKIEGSDTHVLEGEFSFSVEEARP